MKLNDNTHTTNYLNTFIEVSADCPALCGEIPKAKSDKKTVAQMQFEMLSKNPYKYTSDDILFDIFAKRNDLLKSEYKKAREIFFSKGQACFRTSPLTKRYGFGIHADSNGKIALYGRETDKYQQFLADKKIQKVKAMRNSKK